MSDWFVRLPLWLLRSTRLSPTAKLLLVRLEWHQNSETGQCDPRIRKLAAEIGVSESTVQRTLPELTSAGLVRITWGQRSSQYEVAPRAQWERILNSQIDRSENNPEQSERPNTFSQIDRSDAPYL